MEPADWIEDNKMILVVDPGDTTGYAIFFEDDGELHIKGQADFDNFLEFLMGNSFDHIVVEDYRLRKGKQAQQTGSRFQAVQVIGALKYVARQEGIKLELVDVQAKTLGSMYSGIKPPSDHKKSHEIDAYNIGIYWLVKNGIIYPPAIDGL